MCLILVKPKGAEVESDLVELAGTSNRDGFGLMFAMPEKKKVKVIKGLFKLDQQKYIFKQHEHLDLVCHWRLGTSGAISYDNVHPFQLTSLEKHGRDMWICHNGMISQVGTRGKIGPSDTNKFASEYLGVILRKDPSKIDDADFRDNIVAKAIGSYNKLVILDGEGKVFIINKSSGTEEKGCWYSNSYFGRNKWACYG